MFSFNIVIAIHDDKLELQFFFKLIQVTAFQISLRNADERLV